MGKHTPLAPRLPQELVDSIIEYSLRDAFASALVVGAPHRRNNLWFKYRTHIISLASVSRAFADSTIRHTVFQHQRFRALSNQILSDALLDVSGPRIFAPIAIVPPGHGSAEQYLLHLAEKRVLLMTIGLRSSYDIATRQHMENFTRYIGKADVRLRCGLGDERLATFDLRMAYNWDPHVREDLAVLLAFVGIVLLANLTLFGLSKASNQFLPVQY